MKWLTCCVLAVMAWLGAACSSMGPAFSSASLPPLYVQLGGESGIQAFTRKTLDRVSQDPRSMRSFKGIKMPFLSDSVAKYICKVADGPCVYEGEDMAKSHASAHITGSEFEFMVTVLREELDAAGVNQGAKNELLRRLAPSHAEIVKP